MRPCAMTSTPLTNTTHTAHCTQYSRCVTSFRPNSSTTHHTPSSITNPSAFSALLSAISAQKICSLCHLCQNLSIVSHCSADCAPFTMSHKFNYTQQAPSPTLPHAPHFQQLIGHKKQQTVTLTKETIN